MINILCLVALILLGSNVYASVDQFNPLPMWIDHTREFKKEDLFKSPIPYLPPPISFRLVAEYEPARAVVIGWAGYSSILKNIAKIATRFANVEVWAARGPSKLEGVSPKKYKKLRCDLNTVWMRDYGPFGIIEGTDQVGVVDSIYRHHAYRRKDDRMPSCVGKKKNFAVFPMDLVLDGGNLMVDSKRNLFMTKRTYEWNRGKSREEVDELIRDYFNVEEIHVLDYAEGPSGPADGTGHIDMFVKLLDDSTVLITKTEDEPFRTACEKAAAYFSSIKAPDGDDYKIIRIKGWKKRGTWYTYTNSLIVNNVVIMPGYAGYANDEREAIEAYRTGIPGVIVKVVNSDSSIHSGGSIHCVTQLIPK